MAFFTAVNEVLLLFIWAGGLRRVCVLLAAARRWLTISSMQWRDPVRLVRRLEDGTQGRSVWQTSSLSHLSLISLSEEPTWPAACGGGHKPPGSVLSSAVAYQKKSFRVLYNSRHLKTWIAKLSSILYVLSTCEVSLLDHVAGIKLMTEFCILIVEVKNFISLI